MESGRVGGARNASASSSHAAWLAPSPENAAVEPDDAMAEAAVLLCGAPPGTLTGRIVYSMELLGRPLPDGPWALSKTF